MDADDPRLPDLLARLHQVAGLAHTIDARPRTFDTGQPLTRAEVHTLSHIATEGPHVGITGLADLQGVTKGAASQVVTRLVDKGLVEKRRSGGRGVALTPTDVGWRAHRAHVRFHTEISAFLAQGYPDGTTVARDLEALDRLLGLMLAWQQAEEA